MSKMLMDFFDGVAVKGCPALRSGLVCTRAHLEVPSLHERLQRKGMLVYPHLVGAGAVDFLEGVIGVVLGLLGILRLLGLLGLFGLLGLLGLLLSLGLLGLLGNDRNLVSDEGVQIFNVL